MNRRQRRSAAIRRADGETDRIPVFGPGDHIVALVRPQDAQRYAEAPNARLVRRRATGQVVRINLQPLSDDSKLEIHRGNPRRYSHDHATFDNPPRVWTMRHLANADTSVDLYTRQIYRASVLDNLKAA